LDEVRVLVRQRGCYREGVTRMSRASTHSFQRLILSKMVRFLWPKHKSTTQKRKLQTPIWSCYSLRNEELFFTMDLDGSGGLSPEELANVLYEQGDYVDGAALTKVLETMDANANGLVSFMEALEYQPTPQSMKALEYQRTLDPMHQGNDKACVSETRGCGEERESAHASHKEGADVKSDKIESAQPSHKSLFNTTTVALLKASQESHETPRTIARDRDW